MAKSKQCLDPCDCPASCDLILLRDAAKDERKAIMYYMQCYWKTCMNLFLETAEDEIEHFLMLMRLISCYDPIQARCFHAQNLDCLTLTRADETSLSYRKNQDRPMKQPQNPLKVDLAVDPPAELDGPCMECLTMALDMEFGAINKYQEYMLKAEHNDVKKLFCCLMNDEKHHVAETIAAIFCITHEPLNL